MPSWKIPLGQPGEETKTCPKGYCTTHKRLGFMLMQQYRRNKGELTEVVEMDGRQANSVEITVPWPSLKFGLSL
ncbi:uncharacterized protein N7500_001241 [Penicillium coprophilum]|uniref:uncharacterized protein n=1 Tax=Penicillium coprophilum TaxID=36646 RepID=UPI00239C4A19|nr:uncharacterized protein N7500_001241 [Penicillium coprophilum]KAJ5178542.1 hypothetical protein N7500_001241 [Penicillium coprophilum]